MSPINLIAHRGYQKQYPENTLIGLAEAIKAGARFVETDIQLSADKVPVLYHDRHMRRISGMKGAIQQYAFADLIHFPAHEPERFGDRFRSQTITPLADLVTLLLAHPHVHAFIEIKRSAIEAHGIAPVYQRVTDLLLPVANQCALISFSVPFLSYAHRTAWPQIGVVLEQWNDASSEALLNLKPAYMFCNYTKLPLSGTLTIPDTQLAIYEIDDPQIAFELNRRGVNLIETFAFAEMHYAITHHREEDS